MKRTGYDLRCVKLIIERIKFYVARGILKVFIVQHNDEALHMALLFKCYHGNGLSPLRTEYSGENKVACARLPRTSVMIGSYRTFNN
jgi:hypothetical protein